jgi:lipopolysaccharide export system permease protein
VLGTIDRYIGRAVLTTSGVVLLAFIGLMTVFNLVDELRGDGGAYQFSQALWYVALTTPRRIYELLPYVVFLGALIGLGGLANHSEIVVLRSAGVSVQRIFASVALPAIAILVLGAALGEFVAPKGEELAEAYKTRTEQESAAIILSDGYWYREGSLYMNVDGLGEQGELLGVRQYWLDADKRMTRSRSASSAEYRPGDDAHWVLFDVTETQFLAQTTEVNEYLELRWNGQVDPRLLSARVLVEPTKLSVADLYYQISYMRREGLDPRSYQLALWGKLLQPLAVLGLALLALCFVLGPLREVGIGTRLSVGVLVGLIFKYLQDLFAPLSLVYEVPAALAVAIPIAVCWLIGWVGLRRVA